MIAKIIRINVVPKYCSVKLEVNSQIADELKKLLLQKVSDEIAFTKNEKISI